MREDLPSDTSVTLSRLDRWAPTLGDETELSTSDRLALSGLLSQSATEIRCLLERVKSLQDAVLNAVHAGIGALQLLEKTEKDKSDSSSHLTDEDCR